MSTNLIIGIIAAIIILVVVIVLVSKKNKTKKDECPIDADKLIKALGASGIVGGHLTLTMIFGKASAIICETVLEKIK